MTKKNSGAKFRAYALFLWLALSCIGFAISSAEWYRARYLIDSTEKSINITGTAAWPALEPILWLSLLAAFACIFFAKQLALAVAALAAAFFSYLCVALFLQFTSGNSQAITNLLAQKTGVTGDFQISDNGNFYGYFCLLLGLLVLAQTLTAFAIFKAPKNLKSSRYDKNIGSERDSSISLWDSQA